MKYEIEYSVTTIYTVWVDADNETEAMQIVHDGKTGWKKPSEWPVRSDVKMIGKI